jgi:hypothetical protein
VPDLRYHPHPPYPSAFTLGWWQFGTDIANLAPCLNGSISTSLNPVYPAQKRVATGSLGLPNHVDDFVQMEMEVAQRWMRTEHRL